MRTLEELEYDNVWNSFENNFSFRPSVSGPFPAINEPKDSITFRLAADYDDVMIDELQSAISDAFMECGIGSQEIYYLDWQHECYAIKINQIPTSWANGFPDGDYAIFITTDMKAGTFGHPWESSICIFGRNFVNSLLKRKPKILKNIIRNEGLYEYA